jgi:hypothetical protein
VCVLREGGEAEVPGKGHQAHGGECVSDLLQDCG